MPAQVAEACAEAAAETGLTVAAANLNSPGQTVISGALAAVERAAAIWQGQGRAARGDAAGERAFPLRADAAGAGGSGAGARRHLQLSDPRIPVAANVTGALVTTAAAARDALMRQVTGAVRWVDCVQALVGAGAKRLSKWGRARC